MLFLSLFFKVVTKTFAKKTLKLKVLTSKTSRCIKVNQDNSVHAKLNLPFFDCFIIFWTIFTGKSIHHWGLTWTLITWRIYSEWTSSLIISVFYFPVTVLYKLFWFQDKPSFTIEGLNWSCYVHCASPLETSDFFWSKSNMHFFLGFRTAAFTLKIESIHPDGSNLCCV